MARGGGRPLEGHARRPVSIASIIWTTAAASSRPSISPRTRATHPSRSAFRTISAFLGLARDESRGDGSSSRAAQSARTHRHPAPHDDLSTRDHRGP